MKINTRKDILIKRSPPTSRFVTNGLICIKLPAAPWKPVYHCLSYTWFLGMISVGWIIMMPTYLPRQMHSVSGYRDCVITYSQLCHTILRMYALKFQYCDCKSWGQEENDETLSDGRNFLPWVERKLRISTCHFALTFSINYVSHRILARNRTRLFHAQNYEL